MKRTLFILCTFALCLSLLPVTALAADGDVTYQYYDTETKEWQTGTKSSGEYTTTGLGYGTTLGSAGAENWYVADGTGSALGSTISVNGDVHLILAGSCNLSRASCALNITDGSSLTIYGQYSSSGVLSLTSSSGSGAIALNGSSTLTIHSGKLTLTNVSGANISVGSGTLNIYGGTVVSGSNTGITVSSGGAVNIYGGTVSATSSSYGIISGDGNINISGNAVITGSISGANEENWNGIINYTVYGTVTLPESLLTSLDMYLTVPDGAKLILPDGTTIPTSGAITVESGGTLTVAEGSTVYNKSSITVNEGGTLSGGGTIINQGNGATTGSGDTSGVTILYDPTVTVTSQSIKAENVADQSENVTFTATVTGNDGTPAGTVQFKDGDTDLGSSVELKDGTATCTVPASTLGLGDHTITAIYTPAEGSSYTTNTGSLAFIVVGAVSGIEVTTQPTKMEYTTGQTLDLTGLEITVSYEGSENYKSVLSWGAEGITASRITARSCRRRSTTARLLSSPTRERRQQPPLWPYMKFLYKPMASIKLEPPESSSGSPPWSTAP